MLSEIASQTPSNLFYLQGMDRVFKDSYMKWKETPFRIWRLANVIPINLCYLYTTINSIIVIEAPCFAPLKFKAQFHGVGLQIA